MDVIWKVIITAITVCILAMVIKSQNSSAVIPLALAGICVIFYLIMPQIQSITDFCQTLIASIGIDESIFLPVLKVTIIAICVRITTELCSDAGMRAMGVKLELAGAVMGIICALPLIRQALELINGL